MKACGRQLGWTVTDGLRTILPSEESALPIPADATARETTKDPTIDFIFNPPP